MELNSLKNNIFRFIDTPEMVDCLTHGIFLATPQVHSIYITSTRTDTLALQNSRRPDTLSADAPLVHPVLRNSNSKRRQRPTLMREAFANKGNTWLRMYFGVYF